MLHVTCRMSHVTCMHSVVVVMIHWTRQIKEVLANQEAMETADSSGPLEEIEFWRARCEDLSGLTVQLHKPGILRVVKLLEKAKSSYLTPFRRLSRMIQVIRCPVETSTHLAKVVCYKVTH